MDPVQTEATPTEPALDLAILYRRERAFVRSVLASLGVATAALDDAIQDVFVVVFRRLRDYDQRRGTMRAWLFGIAMRVAAKQRRRARPIHTLVALDIDDAALGDPERYVARLGAAAIADRLISAVPAEQWVPFVMAEVEGMTAPEIADALGLRIATVYTRIHRARRRLERERARVLDDRPSTWWGLLVARIDGWSRPRPLATAAFISVRMALALALTAAALAFVAVWIARDGREASTVAGADAGATEPSASRRRSGSGGDDDETAALTRGPVTIAGRVTTPSGPLRGARVCAWREPNQMDARANAPIRCALTGGDGRYELGSLSAGRWIVSASASGWAPAAHRPPRPATSLDLRGGERRDGVDIAFVDPGTLQRVVVRDVTGGPIEGALVFAGSDWSGMPDSWIALPPSVGETGPEGVVELSVRTGRTTVRARAEGYADGMRHGSAPSPEVELVLAPESAITGRVVAEGVPVAAARVTATIQHGPMPERVANVLTDEDGRFRLVGLAPGSYRVNARADGAYGEIPSALSLGFAERIDDIVIETAKVGSLRGTVAFEGSGEPCRGGFVALMANATMVADGAAIGIDGDVEFDAVVPGTYMPYVLCFAGASKERYAEVVVAGTESQTVEWKVDAGAIVSGTVRDHAGKAVARADVTLAGTGAWRSAVTDASGRYEIVGVSSGSYQIQAVRNQTSTSGSAEVVVGATGASMDLEILESARLEGRVVDRAGAPVASAFVNAMREQNGNVGWQEGTGATDRDGRFTLEVDPGTWHVLAEIDGVRSKPGTTHVVAGETGAVELTLDARRGILRGRAVDADGSPVADASVVVRAIDDPANGRAVLDALRTNAELVRGRVTLTDDEGRFRVELRAGPHVVLVRRRGGGEAWKLGVEIGQDVLLEIPDESALAGTVTSPSGEPPGRMSVRVASEELGLRREETFVLGGGRFRIEGLPAGRYVVTARAPDGVGRTEATLAKGEVKDDLAITLGAGEDRGGRFVDLDTGDPIANVFAIAGSPDDAPAELAMRAQIAVETGDPKTKSDADGRFTLVGVTSDVVRIGAIPGDFMTSPYGVAIFEVPAKGGLPDVPLVKLRVGRDDVAGTFGLELTRQRREICHEDPTVAAVSGPAAAAGVRVGDTITAIDGKDVADWRCYLAVPLLTTKPGTSVTLTLGRGDSVTIVSAAK